MPQFVRIPVVVAALWIAGVVGGWQSLSTAIADDESQAKTSKAPAYRRVKTPAEAIARIRELGGRVRYVSKHRKVLVVDLRYAVEGLSDDHLGKYDPSWSNEQVIEWDGNFRNDGALMLVCCERDVEVEEYRQVLERHLAHCRQS